MSYLKHKPGSIEELMANEASKLNDNAYQDMFKKELDKAGKGIGGMSPKEKKDFFNKIDDKYKAKTEELSAGQKKLPDALKKVIMKKMSGKTEEDAYDKDDEKPAKPKKEETKDEANDVDNGDEKHPTSAKQVKRVADSGSKLTKVETEPKADFKN